MMITQLLDYSVYNQPPYLLQFMKDGDVAAITHCTDYQFNDFEAAAFAIMGYSWLDQASGNSLDILGKHLNLDRNGRDDPTYATLLKIAAFINVSSGQPDELITAVKSLYGASHAILSFTYPMKITITQNGALALFMIQNYILDDTFNYVLDNGDTYMFNIEDTTANLILAKAVPSGVALTIVQG